MNRVDNKVYLVYDKLSKNNLFIFMDKNDDLMKRQIKTHYNSLPKDITLIEDDVQIYNICKIDDNLNVELGDGFICNLKDLKPSDKYV